MSKPMTPAEVAAHLAAGTTTWITTARVLADECLSCVDGREAHSVFGTPGGDAGELLLALAAYEDEVDADLEDDSVAELVWGAIGSLGRFYMHTDAHAMRRLAAALTGDARSRFTDLGGNVKATEALVRDAGDRGEALARYLIDPNHVGCGHLKLILLHPDEYGVRPRLARTFILAVFRKMWAGGDIEYVVLPGGHAEGAVVQITDGKPIQPFVRAPKVSPFNGETQVFIAHPGVVGWYREQVCGWLAAQPGMDVDAGALLARVNALAGVQLGETLGHLAKGLPVFTASIDAHGKVDVQG